MHTSAKFKGRAKKWQFKINRGDLQQWNVNITTKRHAGWVTDTLPDSLSYRLKRGNQKLVLEAQSPLPVTIERQNKRQQKPGLFR